MTSPLAGTLLAALLATMVRAGSPAIDEAAARSATARHAAMEAALAVPTVGDFAPLAGGGVAWVETGRGAANLYAAHPPDYSPARLTDNERDDGVAITIAAASPHGRQLLYFLGGLPNRAGETPNPLHLAEPPERTLQVLDVATRATARIAGGAGASIRDAVFSADGSRVFFVSGGELWSFALQGGSGATRLAATRGAVRSLVASPDGRRLAFVSDRSIYGRGKYAFVGVLDLQTRVIRYLAPGVGIDQSPAWSADGTRVAFIRLGHEPKTWRFSNHRSGAPFAIVVAEAATGDGGPIWSSEPGYGARFSGFGPDGYEGFSTGGDLLWLADGRLVFPCEKTGWRLLYAVAPNGAPAELLTPGRFEIDGATLSPDRSTVVFWSNSAGDPHRLHLSLLSSSTGWKARTLTAGDGIEHEAVFASNGRSLFYKRATPTSPQRLVALDGLKTEIELSSGRTAGELDLSAVATAEIVTFQATDGLRIPAVLWRPRGQFARHSARAVLHAHGGSRDKVYPAWKGFPILRYLMSRGYFVLSVNYRSGIGYGLDFREPPSYGGRGAGDVQDFVAAARYLASNVPEVDPSKLVIFGHSYGGHIVSNALARSDVFAAGVDSAGVGDWVVEMETDSGEVLPFNIAQRAELEQLAFDSSAIAAIEGWGREPILFLHGDDDRSAALQQTIELYLALQRRGKPVEAAIFPGEAHSLLLYRDQLEALRRIDTFLRRHVE